MIIRPAIAVMLLCVAVTGPNVFPAAAKSGGDLVKVKRDIDVYAEAGGVGKPLGVLRKNSEVNLINERNDHWCNVQGASVPAPGNIGWVWCGIGDDGKNYGLKPVVAETPKEPDEAPMGGGGGSAQPMKYDCKTIGPNEQAGGGSNDPKVTFKCEDLGDGKQECCFYKQP